MLWIIVDDGETFEGDLRMFRDCFFDNASRELIEMWAEDNEMKVVFEER